MKINHIYEKVILINLELTRDLDNLVYNAKTGREDIIHCIIDCAYVLAKYQVIAPPWSLGNLWCTGAVKICYRYLEYKHMFWALMNKENLEMARNYLGINY